MLSIEFKLHIMQHLKWSLSFCVPIDRLFWSYTKNSIPRVSFGANTRDIRRNRLEQEEMVVKGKRLALFNFQEIKTSPTRADWSCWVTTTTANNGSERETNNNNKQNSWVKLFEYIEALAGFVKLNNNNAFADDFEWKTWNETSFSQRNSKYLFCC